MGWFPKNSADYGEDVRARLEIGTRVNATTYLEAMELREKFIRQFHTAVSAAHVDALVVPTTPIPAPLIGEESTTINGKDHATRALLLRLNRPANLAGIPAITLPYGLTPSSLPIGIQLIGCASEDASLLAAAAVMEKLLPHTGHALHA